MVHASGIPSGFFQLGTDPNDEYYLVSATALRLPGDDGSLLDPARTCVQIQSTTAP